MKFNYLYIIIILTMSSCNNSKENDSKVIEGKIIHSVYFWLNNPDNIEGVRVRVRVRVTVRFGARVRLRVSVGVRGRG